jgi:hypothetical protein
MLLGGAVLAILGAAAFILTTLRYRNAMSKMNQTERTAFDLVRLIFLGVAAVGLLAVLASWFVD